MEVIRGIIESIQAAAGKVRRFTASGRVGEKFRNALLFQQSHVTSAPEVGTRVIILQSGNLVAGIAEDNPDDRPDLDSLAGAVAIHSDADHYILLKTDGSVEINTDQAVTVLSDDIRLGSASALALKKLIDDRIIALFNAHVHTDPISGFTGVPTVPLSDVAVATSKVRGI